MRAPSKEFRAWLRKERGTALLTLLAVAVIAHYLWNTHQQARQNEDFRDQFACQIRANTAFNDQIRQRGSTSDKNNDNIYGTFKGLGAILSSEPPTTAAEGAADRQRIAEVLAEAERVHLEVEAERAAKPLPDPVQCGDLPR